MVRTVCLIFTIVVMFGGCSGSTTGPEPPPPPPPDENKYYDLQVEYIRTEILRPDQVNCGIYASLIFPEGGLNSQFFSQVDDTHYKGEFIHVKGGVADYWFHTIDVARYDGVDESSAVVGDRFIVTVKQTGAAVELKDIRPNTWQRNPYQGPKAEAAHFQLTVNGEVISNAQ